MSLTLEEGRKVERNMWVSDKAEARDGDEDTVREEAGMRLDGDDAMGKEAKARRDGDDDTM